MSDSPAEKKPGRGSDLIARDQRGLLGNVSLTVSGQAAAFAAGLATMFVTARLLGAAGYGRLNLFFMFYAVLSQVVVGWPNVGLVRFGREELGRSGAMAKTFWGRIVLFLPSVGVTAVLLFLFRRQVKGYLQIKYAPHVLLLLYVSLNEITLLMRGAFQTVGRFRAYALATFGMRALKLPVILGAFVALGWSVGVAEIIGAHLVSIAVVAMCVAAFLPWGQLRPIRTDGETVRRLFAYSWPLMLGGLSVLVVDWVDHAVIKHFLTGEELGQYAVSYQPVTVMTHLCIAFVGAVLPLLVSLAVERRHKTLVWFLDDALPQIAWAAGVGCVLMAALAEAIPLILGEEYRPSVVPCQVLMAGVGFSLVAALQVAMAQAVDRVRAVTGVMVALAALNIGLDLILVPRVGIIGAAVATAIAFALSGLLYFPLLNAISYLRGDAPRRRYAALLGLMPVAAVAVAAVLLDTPARRLLACLVIAAIAAGSARWVGVFRVSTLDRLEKVRMPEWARILVRGFYHVFGKRAKGSSG